MSDNYCDEMAHGRPLCASQCADCATPPTPDPRERGEETFEEWYERIRRERGGAAGPLDAMDADATQMLLAAYYDRAPAPSEAVASSTWGDLAPVVAVVLSASGVQAHEWDNLRADEQRDTLARIIGTMHPAPARGVTEAMVVKAKMAMEGWRGDSHRYACLDLFRRGEDGMVRLHRALTAALTPDAP